MRSKKGDKQMKKEYFKRIGKASVMLLAAAAMAFSAVAAPQAQATTYEASFIRERNDIAVDYTQYLDSSKMFKLPDTVSADQEISVIVTMDETALMDAYEGTDKAMGFAEYALESEDAKALNSRIDGRQQSLLAALDDQQITYSTGHRYNTLFAGFEIVIRAGDYEAVCQSLGKGEAAVVSEEYRVAETKLVENTVNVYDTGIFQSGDSGYDGTGMVVAVLDTGLDSAHSAFDTANFTSDTLGLTYDQVAAVLDRTAAYKQVAGLTVDDVYINEKVPYGFDYADGDPDVYSTHNNHGTHVSGVIVGKDDTITGVAPNAQLVSMKIFSDVVDTARASWILSALEDCVILGVDVINMSLGTACGFSREGDEELTSGVYQKIREAGISLVVAASNSYSSAYGSEKNGNLGLTSNPDTGTVGSPSTYEGALSVASIDGVETPYIKYGDTIIYFDEATDGASEEKDFCKTLLGDQESVQMEYVLIPGVGRSADYTGLDVTGKIALVRRGSNTFEEKAMIAEAQGAAGIIIYNNVSGDIKMNVGEAELAVCSISQDDGEMLAAKGSGKLTISIEQTSGPFISDFSSWGPSPNLQIKPDITAHGGKILSSITGGGYDRLSGTSMACPNLAGVIILLRQYVVENFPDIANDNSKVNAMVNQLLMSTADIALNTNGLPYAVRKQGAGLANLLSSIHTTAYIATYNQDGEEMTTSKLELGDDPEKTGVYEMNFTVKNFGDKKLTYDIGSYVMTEGVSETKTNAGETTVTEQGYILEGAQVDIACTEGGTLKGTKLTVDGGANAKVTVTVTLSDSDKEYLDQSFENGMYVEGFITLTATKGTDIDLNVPFLAFYGDWAKAPLFDLDYFATNADELDDAIAVEDKTMADAYATRPIGGVEDDYVSYLGTYYFIQDPKDMVISANRDYIALSNHVGTIHSLRFVWAGLLRNAAKIEITITDDTTGEVIFETVDTDVRKSYSDGGASIYPANVEIEFDTTEYNLMNNSEYTVKLVGYLDHGDGGLEANENPTFEFPLVVDIEAPSVTDVEFYYEYDKTLEKNRLYAKVGIYDNHYTMASQLGYVTAGTDEEGNAVTEMKSFEQFMTPVYSQRDSTTYVTYELTDYIYTLKENGYNDNTFVLTCYDYALNYATYEIGLPNNYTDFYYDGLEEGLTLSPNEVYTLEPLVYPTTEWAELLEFASSRPSVVRVVNNKLVAVEPGVSTVRVRDPKTNKSVTFQVTVLGEEDEGYRRYDKPVADVFRLDGYETVKAYYMVSSEDKELGDTGDTRFFEGNFNLSMYPSESVRLNHTLDAYFPNDTTVAYESSNESIVTIDQNGVVTAVAEGFASVTIKVLQDEKSTYYSETVSVEVKDPYVTTGASLTHYYGNGGVVMIPEDLRLTEIGSFAFANFDYVLKTEEELAFDDAETSKMWYIGEATVTKVIIPEGVEKINNYAFANLTALEEVVLPSTLEFIEYGAFYGCSELEKITFSGENNLKVINQNAFEKCDLQGKLDLSAACMISPYAFAGNVDLEEVITGENLLSIGQYAFAGCKKLETVTITAEKVKYGMYAFTDCESLKSFYVNAAVLPEGMFYECENLENVSIGPDVNEIGQYAFRDTKVASFEVKEGNTAYKVQTQSYILSADGDTLVAVAPTLEGVFAQVNAGGGQILAVAKGAFSSNTKITTVELPHVTKVGDYAFGSATALTSVALNTLTDIGEYAFFETGITQLPAITTETAIGKYAFSHTAVTSVTIPDGAVLPEGVFSECLALQSVTIGNDVTVGDYAFFTDKDNAFHVLSYDENGERYFYYEFGTALTELTVGSNAKLGKNAFGNAASLETVTLGAGAEIGEMAFYNNAKLKTIDLSQAVSIGNYAFSGDVYNVCLDDSMAYAAVSLEGTYIYTYHAPALESVDLAAATAIGEHAFSYCRQLHTVSWNDQITEIPQYAFAGCVALQNVDLSKITAVGDYAFLQSGLVSADLSAVTTVGEYAFVESASLASIKFAAEGITLDEGAFCYCPVLAAVEGSHLLKEVGAYAFANTAISQIDLSGAENIGDRAFLKEELTPFAVTLGAQLKELGDNPFAMCVLEPFCQKSVESFNGVDREIRNYNYDLSDAVSVIDGSLYLKVGGGLELIAYAGPEPTTVRVADGTLRITSYAFAGAKVELVELPNTLQAIGHKAFYGCDSLHTVIFNSYNAPMLEEEFDPAYYESYEHVPGAGDYGTYTDYDGSEVQITGNGIVPYFMWNATGGLYSNVFYGANFVDYVGYVEDKLTMVRPVNGEDYDSYIYSQYFDLTINGAAAPDDVTMAAISAIDAIPEKVTYEQRHLVEAAREAYGKIATTEQLAQVTNYTDLISAEQRITALTPTDEPVEEAPQQPEEEDNGGSLGVVLVLLAAAAGCGGWLLVKKLRKAPNTEAPQEAAEEAAVEEAEVVIEQIEQSQEETTQTEEAETAEEE